MIKCKEGACPHGQGVTCCHGCSVVDCNDRCDDDVNTCGNSIIEDTKSADLVPFQSKAMVIMQRIADLDLQKKQLEAQDKEVRQQLQKAMAEYGIKSFENDILKVTYIAPSTRTTIDSAKLKKELPAVAEKYTKISQVKGSVRIEVK